MNAVTASGKRLSFLFYRVQSRGIVLKAVGLESIKDLGDVFQYFPHDALAVPAKEMIQNQLSWSLNSSFTLSAVDSSQMHEGHCTINAHL